MSKPDWRKKAQTATNKKYTLRYKTPKTVKTSSLKGKLQFHEGLSVEAGKREID